MTVSEVIVSPIEHAALVAIGPADWKKARLPILYQRAKQVLLECETVDECQRWNAKAEALASYYRQAKDDSLVAIARRIQLRAWRRIGELLKEADKLVDPFSSKLGGTKLGHDNGLDRRQIYTARSMADMPEGVFDAIVDSDHPPPLSAFNQPRKLTEAGAEYYQVSRAERLNQRLDWYIRGLAALLRRQDVKDFSLSKTRRDDLEAVMKSLAKL